MSCHHLVRVGALGSVGRFTSVDARIYPRHARVVVRTGRGLELGEVLAEPSDEFDPQPGDGSLLRGVTTADELLAARLEKNRQSAFAACSARLAAMELPATLMDVEHLFDGRTLLFYFLGEVTPELEELTAELAEIYEAKVQFRKFAAAVTEGCGPDCGVGEGGCSSCTTGCAVASACSTRRHA
jgi:cell fate regulator YaaT (PSP1 superfamily)